MKNLIKFVLTSALILTSINASDLLSKATGGSISDNTFGVKELSVSEMKDVLGGYITSDIIINGNKAIIIA